MIYPSLFLQQLDNTNNRILYVRITALNLNDQPLETIEGKVSSGNINIDGNSAVRRTCSLSLVAPLEDTIITDPYWCFNTKFKLEVGLQNDIEINYPNIIWFEQGIYIITSFSISKNPTSLMVNISGKDKMCRLNGEVNGAIPAQHDFGVMEKIQSDGTVLLEKIPIKTIIREAVSLYGQEREENIIINDLDDNGFELWAYQGNVPLYYLMNSNTNNIDFVLVGQEINVYENGNYKSIKDISKFYSMNTLDPYYNDNASKVSLSTNNTNQYYVIQVLSDETAGYHQIPLVYNTDLILNAGETITSLLDKLKSMLGNYEYFYNTKGQFVFQRKNDYIQELFSTSSGAMSQPMMKNEFYSYKFMDESKFTAISYAPQINNIKNYFIVWGTKKSATNQSLSFHACCAIDKKPERYQSINPNSNTIYITEQYKGTKTANMKIVDWRELIYQMAIDYYRYNTQNNYLLLIEKANPDFKKGITGYEPYYLDIQGFWRQLYNPNPSEDDIYQYGEFYDENQGKWAYWNKLIHTDPMRLNFWFEFIDTAGELGKYGVNKIGLRSKVTNEKNVSSIYYKETPEVQFIIVPDESYEKTANTSYTPVQISSADKEVFYRSAQGASAISKINELIQNYTACGDAINITSVPIFYLQPNTRIYVEGYGDYTITKLSYNLSYSGTMTINGTKILKQIV